MGEWDIKKIFGDNVRALCDQNHLSKRDLAQMTLIDLDIIDAIWEGVFDAELYQVEAIARALDVEVFNLILPPGYEAVQSH